MTSPRQKPPTASIPSFVSVVTQLAESIRRSLAAGEWTTRLPSERELTERFKVSRPTLRKALGTLAEEGIVRAEQGRGWRISHPGAAPKTTRQVRSVGIVCFVPLDEASPFNLFAIDKLQNHLHNAGLIVHVHAGTQYGSQNYRQALDRLVRGTRADAWVLLASMPGIIRWFRERKLPFFLALAPRPITDCPAMYLDMQALHRHALGMLMRRGHRRIALVMPRPTVVSPGIRSTLAEPEASYSWESAMETYRKIPGFQCRAVLHSRTAESVEHAVGALLKSPEPPTAMVVMRPQHTLSALTCLMRAGKRVPEDVSVIGIGHEPFLDHVRPSIAHYVLDRRTYARNLCRLVLAWVRSGHWKASEGELFMGFQDGESLAAPI